MTTNQGSTMITLFDQVSMQTNWSAASGGGAGVGIGSALGRVRR